MSPVKTIAIFKLHTHNVTCSEKKTNVEGERFQQRRKVRLAPALTTNFIFTYISFYHYTKDKGSTNKRYMKWQKVPNSLNYSFEHFFGEG